MMSELERRANRLVGSGAVEASLAGAAAVIANPVVVAVTFAVIAVTFALVDGSPVRFRESTLLSGHRLDLLRERLAEVGPAPSAATLLHLRSSLLAPARP